MDTRKRKVGFYYLITKTSEDNIAINDELIRIINFIISQDKKDRKFSLNNDKFCFLDTNSLNNEQIIQELVFKSASHNYRAPLIDSETIAERENPKTLNEGESVKTHFLVKYKDGDAILLGEKLRSGLTTAQLVDYLNEFKRSYEKANKIELKYHFGFETVIKDNIDDELEKMSRVLSTSVYVDKQLLGGDALNFSNRTQSVQENIVVEIKATRSQSIMETTKDILAKLNGGERIIHKIRIKGKSTTDNDITIDTELIEKREYVVAHLNGETGEVSSKDLLIQLNEIANTL